MIFEEGRTDLDEAYYVINLMYFYGVAQNRYSQVSSTEKIDVITKELIV